jgi:glycosyltransferase involved in cell wall biosynthesis
MKILHINSFGYSAGGTETSIAQLKKELVNRGHQVKVLTSNRNIDNSSFSDYQFNDPGKYRFLRIIYRLFNPYSFMVLRKVLKEFNPDIVHLHRMDLISPSVLFLLRRRPTVMTIHGPEDFIKSLLVWFMPYNYFKKDREITLSNLNLIGKIHVFYHTHIQLHIYKLALKNVDLFIAPSNYFKEVVSKELSPVITIYNGINLLKPSIKNKITYKLLYVGRIDKFKGIDYLIKSLPKILNSYPKTYLTIVGSGNYLRSLKRLVLKLDLTHKVVFLPWKKKHEIEQLYIDSDIVITPSIWPEAFGKVGVEAMSVGRPVIATKVGGMPEWLIHGKTGFLIEPKDSNQIAESAIKLFSDKKLTDFMGANAVKQASKFNTPTKATNLIKVYSQIVEKYQ